METNPCKDLVITTVQLLQQQAADLELRMWDLVEESRDRGVVSAEDWSLHLGLSRATVYRRIGNDDAPG